VENRHNQLLIVALIGLVRCAISPPQDLIRMYNIIIPPISHPDCTSVVRNTIHVLMTPYVLRITILVDYTVSV